MTTLKLARPDLLETRCLIGGEWRDGPDKLVVRNPATGAEVASVARFGPAEVTEAIRAAEAAMPAWAALTAKARAAVMRKWFELMLANADDLAAIMTAEQGKPLAEARGEIVYAASFIEWFGEEGKRIYGDVIPSHDPGIRIVVLKQPIGVTAAITPWNFPAAMITRKAGPALAAGCPMVIKPASATPLSALALCRLAGEAGVPKGILSCIVGNAAAISETFCADPAVRKISFTGSTEIGRELMAQAAQNITKLSLELGGNAPFIVFDDADLDAAVAGAMVSKFRNAGQTCVCANRIYVQTGIHDAFVAKLTEAVGKLRLGDGADAGDHHRPADQSGRADQDRGAYRRCRCQGRDAGRRRQAFGAGRQFLRTDPDHRRASRDAGGGGRNLCPARPGVPLRHCRGCDRRGQRHHFRPRRLFLRPRPLAGLAGGRSARIRDRRGQHRDHLDRTRAVRRGQAIGPRP